MPFLGARGAAPDPRGHAAQPMPGVTEWNCPRNGVHVVELHYTADPAKRDPAWKREAMRGMPPRGWQKEMEIAFDLAAGEPVLPEYVPAEMRRPFPVNASARLLRGWDFGQVCPVTVFAQLDVHGRLGFVGELVLEHANLTTQIEATKAMTMDLVGASGSNCFDAGDPEALHEMELGSIRAVLLRHGIVLQTFAAGRSDASYTNLRDRLLRRVRIPGDEVPSPALIVDPRCPILHSAFAGGFARHPRTGKPMPTHPYKDIVDAARYLHDNLQGSSSEWMQKLQAIAKADLAW